MSAGYTREGKFGAITIDAPPLNLFDNALVEALRAAADAAARDAPRALIVRAEGKVFTGGVDVQIFKGLSEAQARELAEDLLTLTHRIEDLPFPTLAVVHGLCLTAGFELALACDMIFAAKSARFGLVERVVGVTPFMGGTQRVAERAGPARARELVMSGALYEAQMLERWGVVNRVFADGRLAPEAASFAADLAAGPTLAHAATKRIVHEQIEHGTRGADARVAGVAAQLFETADMRNAVETFLAEGPGKATFEGR